MKRKADVPTELVDETPTAPAAAPALPEQPLPYAVVGVEVFVGVSKVKPDQMAGFCRWATLNNLGPMSIPDWEKALHTFNNRPVA